MDFTNGIYLWGILAGALPILLHLYFKRRKHRVKFSTLLFFVKKEKLFSFRRKLYELLLLALRVMILILLALALSRMFFKRFNFISGGGTEAVIILDDSLSMQRRTVSGTTVFDYGKKQAETVLNSLAGDDGAALLFTSGIKGVNLTRDKNLVLRNLREAKPCAIPGSINSALQKACDQLRKSPGVNREIYLISDFAANNKPMHSFNMRSLKNSRLYLLPLHGNTENVSVAASGLSSAPKIVNRETVIPFKITNHGKSVKKITAELKISGKTIQKKIIELKPDSTLSEEFIYTPRYAGRVNACVEIDDQNIPIDNRAWFSFSATDNLNVLLLSNRRYNARDPFYFLHFALSPPSQEAVNGISCQTIDTAYLTSSHLKNQHVVCLAMDKNLSTHAIKLLSDYMYSGGILITVPDTNTKSSFMDAFKNQNSFLLRNNYGKILDNQEKGIKFGSPLSELNDLLQLKLIEWRKFFDFKPSSAKIIASSNSGSPLILEQKTGKGKCFNLAFSLRQDFSNWPSLKSYPVSMVALINYAAGNQEKSLTVFCGSKIDLEGKNIVFSNTDGSKGEFNGDLLNYSNMPGIMTFENADLEAVIFNSDPDESQTALANKEEFTEWFNAPLTILELDSEIVPQIVQFRKGSELTGWILLLMLMLLALEFILGANKRMRKIRTGGKND
jgi:hypothetical protein